MTVNNDVGNELLDAGSNPAGSRLHIETTVTRLEP